LRFAVAEYFATIRRDTFYSDIVIAFRVANDEHYHVPLLLSPFGYSTYRGS
jgi:5-hydroxyisourate hydrolase